MKEIDKGTLRNQKLRETINVSGASMRMQEERSSAERRHGLRANAEPKVPCETPQQPRGHGARNVPKESSVRRGAGAAHVNIPADTKGSQLMSTAGSSTTRPTPQWTSQPLPKYPYHPHPAFTNASRTSAVAISDSGCEIAMEGRTPASMDPENFAVPSTHRVPNSVASVRRRARALPRLSDRKTDRL